MNTVLLKGLVLSFLMGTAAASAKELHLKSEALQLKSNFSKSQSEVSETNYYIVQFKESLSFEHRELLESYGAEFKAFIPDDALLVKISASDREIFRNQQSDKIEQMIPYTAQLRVSNEIRPSVFTKDQNALLVVRICEGENKEDILREIGRYENTRVEDVDGRLIYLVSAYNEIYSIAAIEGVEWIEPVPTFETAYADLGSADNKNNNFRTRSTGDYSDLNGLESGTRIMNLPYAYKRGLSGAGQVVGMADTGLDSGELGKLHPDFGGVFRGYAVALFANSWGDPQGHGTHVAGSVIGTGLESAGKIVGAAPGARFVAQGMWSRMINNIMVPTKLGDMFAQTYDDGARIHTNSWGSPQNLGAYNNFSVQVDEYMWNNQDMLLIFAAGNSGQDLDANGRIDEGSVSSPGTAKNVLTVGASENYTKLGGIQVPLKDLRGGKQKWGAEPIASDFLSDNPNGIAAFSSRGPTSDGRVKPDIVAPGTNILSTRSSHPDAGVLWGAYNDKYVWAGGTSMATPLTAGAAAVMREYLVKVKNQKNPSAALLKASLVHTAKDLFPGQFGVGQRQELLTKRPNVHEGYGRVDLARIPLLDYGMLRDNKLGLAEGENAVYTMRVTKRSAVIVTMAYTDAPGSPSTKKALVNDLDLMVVDKAGNVVLGGKDHTNNLELLEALFEPGDYRIIVNAKRIVNGKNGKQPYALVLTRFNL